MCNSNDALFTETTLARHCGSGMKNCDRPYQTQAEVGNFGSAVFFFDYT